MTHTNRQFTFHGAHGVELFAQSWLPARPPRSVVALVHGFGEHSDRYTYLVDALTGGGYAVYGFDHRGHGRSPGKRGHVDAFADFREDVGHFRAYIQTEASAAPLFLFGHSMGGLIALDAVLHDATGLAGVIASAPLLAPPNVSPLLLTIAGLLSRLAPTFALDTKLDPATISRDPAEVQRYVADPLVHGKTSARAGAEGMRAVNWVQAHAADLRTPLLLYHGAGDQLVPIAGSRTFFANAGAADKTFLELPDGYHESHNDTARAALFLQILSWLDAHTPDASA
jgi:alpha-beta hydrolase superfamily lysophospholipase